MIQCFLATLIFVKRSSKYMVKLNNKTLLTIKKKITAHFYNRQHYEVHTMIFGKLTVKEESPARIAKMLIS